MRLYTFNNFYLSQIQIGIQSLHSTVELFNKYEHNYQMLDIVKDWARNYKTAICLNGGNAGELQEIIEKLHVIQQNGLHLPHSYFREDKQSMNECLTSVAIIVPEYIYNFDETKALREFDFSLTNNEYLLYSIIKSKRLA